MGKSTEIAWTDHTYNPWWGCVKVSEGCKNCYAETFAKRTGNDVWGIGKPRRFFGNKHWLEPLKWNADAERDNVRRKVFCASMADVFEAHSDNDVHTRMNKSRTTLGDLIKKTPSLDWLLLTKRIENAGDYLSWMFGNNMFSNNIPRNLWLGTTCENQTALDKRLPILMQTKWDLDINTAFISIEPQIEKVSLYPHGIENGFPDWVIVGGESGAGHRPFDPDWARSLRDEVHQAGVAFFMKQLGGPTSNKRDRIEDLPEDLRIREYPSGL